jgi:hypothetical protein
MDIVTICERKEVSFFDSQNLSFWGLRFTSHPSARAGME